MSYFVHVRCKDFEISCERLFKPGLEGQPIIILSSDHGSVFAVSEEAKKLGIKVGDPLSKIKAYCNRMDMVFFSLNKKLYKDVSNRIMNLLSSIAEEIEVVANDEAYLKYSSTQTADAILEKCKKMREKIEKWVGIPLSMGVASTKTLAKIANEVAKESQTGGVYDLTSQEIKKKILENYFICNMESFTPRVKEELSTYDVRTVWEFSKLDPQLVRRKVGVNGEKIYRELQGHQEPQTFARNSISYSQTFNKMITNSNALAEALSTFVQGACAQLSEQKSCAKILHISLEAVLDDQQGSHSTFCLNFPFENATNDQNEMMAAAKQCLNKLYSNSERYTKCEFALHDLVPEKTYIATQKKKKTKSDAIETFNAFYDKNQLRYGAMDVNRSWQTKTPKAPQPDEWKGLAFALAK